MRKHILLLICALTVLFFCSCSMKLKGNSDNNLSSSPDNTTTSAKVTTAATTTTAVTTTPPPITYSAKVLSNDTYFSLSSYISDKEVKVNQPITIRIKFKNETNETFNVGIKNIISPACVAILKKDDIWGYEGNDTALCSKISPNQEIEQESTISFSEPGEYQIFIFSDFAREIKSTENASKVDKNLYFPELANSSIMLDAVNITVK